MGLKRFRDFIRENEFDIDESWHHLDHKNPAHSKVVEAFTNLASSQRGAPEAAMLKVTHLHKGGVLNPVVEHIGDLSHRMSEMTKYGNFGKEYVREKVERGLRYLQHPYGFEREHKENMWNNSGGNDISFEKYKNSLDQSLKEYANEHRKLPIYNKAQHHAKEAAIAVGEQRWADSISHLKNLKGMLDSKEGWDHHASKFRFARENHPREYQVGDDNG